MGRVVFRLSQGYISAGGAAFAVASWFAEPGWEVTADAPTDLGIEVAGARLTTDSLAIAKIDRG